MIVLAAYDPDLLVCWFDSASRFPDGKRPCERLMDSSPFAAKVGNTTFEAFSADVKLLERLAGAFRELEDIASPELVAEIRHAK